MRVLNPLSFFVGFLFLALTFGPAQANTSVSFAEAAKLLPNRASDFRASGAARELQASDQLHERYLLQADGLLAAAVRDYVSVKGERFSVLLVKTRSDADAYAFLTRLTMGEKLPGEIRMGDVGTATAFDSTGNISFFKGSAFVAITQNGASRNKNNSETLKALARSLAEALDRGEGDIPVLVKHLPDWESARGRAVYAVSLEGLQNIEAAPVFDAIDFAGGTEAVAVDYTSSQLVIVEFSTPQLAGDNDRRIAARIQELRNQGQPVPTAYRRVGNYLAFVFNGESEQSANQLIDQIRYEQVVRWLGDNPYLLLQAQKEFTETTLGVFVSVVKASGLALVSCLAVGGFFGALLFTRRRAHQKAEEAFSDAGGMLRLNLDEMTPQTDPARLIGPPN